ncbi:MAG: hypothetical protein NT164_01975, partial [Verrucomicrobiae bacterium]|nr:hypothetical protein [Verrucomicrobiae bacterium]
MTWPLPVNAMFGRGVKVRHWTMKNHLIQFACCFLLSTAALFSQYQNQDNASPLMMFRHEAKNPAEEKAGDQLSVGADPRNRTAIEGPSSEAPRGTVCEGRESVPQKQSAVQATLQNDIQRSIQTIAAINVAGDLLQRQEEVKRSLREQHPDIDSLDDLDAYIEEALLKKYKLGIAIKLQDERERDLLSQELEDEKEVAKNFKIRAKGLEVTAQR